MAGEVIPARVGRENQRYDDGKRLVVGSVAFEKCNMGWKILLVSSSKYPNEWTLPKGGWETDETATEGAQRETLEEAVSHIVVYIGDKLEKKKIKK